MELFLVALAKQTAQTLDTNRKNNENKVHLNDFAEFLSQSDDPSGGNAVGGFFPAILLCGSQWDALNMEAPSHFLWRVPASIDSWTDVGNVPAAAQREREEPRTAQKKNFRSRWWSHSSPVYRHKRVGNGRDLRALICRALGANTSTPSVTRAKKKMKREKKKKERHRIKSETFDY